MKIKLNMDIAGHKKSTIIEVLDCDGVPVDEFWRKRLKDSKIDNCIELVSEKAPMGESKKKAGKK
jgi:hypothetical protein